MIPMIDQELLQEYKLYFSPSIEKTHRFSGGQLVRGNGMEELLNIVGAKLQSPSSLVTASLFAKYYSYILISAGLVAWLKLGKPLDLSLQRISLETNEDWSPILVVDSTEKPTKAWKSIHSIFYENLEPIFERLVKETEIPKDILWAHASYAVHYLFDQWMEEADEEEKRGLEHQLWELKSQVTAIDIPFDVIDHPLFEDKKLRIRNKCCMRCCIPGASKCTTCPHLNESARMESLKRYHGLD